MEGVVVDGQEMACWNGNAIQEYVDGVNAREERLATNPDLRIIPGRIACTGCVVNQWGNGVMCSAQLTETQFVVLGDKRTLREEDAFSSMSGQIDGFKFVLPGSRNPIVY